MYPTRRAVFVMALGALISIWLVAAEPSLWTAAVLWLVAGLAVILADGFLATPKQDLDVSITEPAMLFVGASDPLVIEARLRRGGQQNLVAALDVSGEIEPLEPVMLPVGAEHTARHEFELVPNRRGLGKVEALWLRWTGPLGFMQRQTVMEVGLDLPIGFNIRAVRQAAIAFFSRQSFAGIKPQREYGQGSEFHALREFVAGMEPRSIDWKQTARHRKLLSKEFRTERNHHIVMAVDSGYLMREPLGPISRLDHAVNASLMLGFVSLYMGDRVGLHAFDSQIRLFAKPAGGIRTFHRIQRLAAEIDQRPFETNYTLGLSDLASKLRHRSLVVLMTDFVDTTTSELMVENIARLQQKHLVLFVTFRDPQMFEFLGQNPDSEDHVAESVVAADLLREREIVLQRLRRMGVSILETDADKLSTALINRYLAIKERELL